MTPATTTKRLAAPTHARRWRSLAVSPYIYAILVLAVFLGVIGAGQAAGLWVTSGKLAADGKPVELTGASTSEIKGWMTIQDVLSAYQVPQDELYAAFGIPADVPVTSPLKELEALAPDFSVTGLRAWLDGRAAP